MGHDLTDAVDILLGQFFQGNFIRDGLLDGADLLQTC
jgi:hypothetical protein